MTLRDTNIVKLNDDSFDVLIIGAGINGAVSAAALASRGLKVALIDKSDFASETSANSSNLAWGGIKYLENNEVLLVNKLCKSRNRLMKAYPSTVKEIRFLATIQKGFKYPVWFLYLGAIFYWILGRCFTLFPTIHSAGGIKKFEPSINVSDACGGFEYSDAILFDNDARFTFSFVRKAMDAGATVANYVSALHSKKLKGHWQTELKDETTGKTLTLQSKVIINACGPHADAYNSSVNIKTQNHHVFSKGVHLMVEKIAEVNKVLAFFASDGRLFFVIPMGKRTCIGTTDEQTSQPFVAPTQEDRKFILENVNRLLDLDKPLTEADIISERCGVRPLVTKGQRDEADWVKLSRKHVVEVDEQQRFLTIFGGKLTDCLNIGDEICSLIGSLGFKLQTSNTRWYGESSLQIKKEFLERSRLIGLDAMTPDYSSEPLTERLWRRYDMNAFRILDEIQRDPSQAELLMENAEYIRAELHYAARKEMITKLEDFLRRRSKIEMVLKKEAIINAKGLQEACDILFGNEAKRHLDEYMKAKGNA